MIIFIYLFSIAIFHSSCSLIRSLEHPHLAFLLYFFIITKWRLRQQSHSKLQYNAKKESRHQSPESYSRYISFEFIQLDRVCHRSLMSRHLVNNGGRNYQQVLRGQDSLHHRSYWIYGKSIGRETAEKYESQEDLSSDKT